MLKIEDRYAPASLRGALGRGKHTFARLADACHLTATHIDGSFKTKDCAVGKHR